MDSDPKPLKYHALIVEDNPEAALLLRHWLQRLDMMGTIVSVGSAEEAVTYLNNCIRGEDPARFVFPSFMILDLNLPGEHGLDLLQRIKQNEKLKAIPIVVNTASDKKEDLPEAYRRGGSLFLRKGASKEEFLQMITQMRMSGMIKSS